MIQAALIAIARAILMSVISALAKQLVRMVEEALKPMQDVVKMLSGNNDVWRGAGADKFVEVVSSLLIPSAQIIHDQVEQVKTNLGIASDTIDQADTDAAQMVRSRLYDGFNFYQG